MNGMMRRVLLLMVVLFSTAVALTLAQEASWLDDFDTFPCPDSDFTCLTLTMPLDHFDADNEATIDVTFAVLPATGERKGLFVTATGGPGYSGLAAADWYSSYFDPAVTEHFDSVFFDQRGIGLSGGLDCSEANAAYYQADLRADTPEQEAALIAAARAFAEDCTAEMDAAAWYPYLGTEQAVEDLEAFRQLVGDDQLWLYGESYGTQFAQTYATAYPDRVAGLILDGVVDLTLEGHDYYVEQARAFDDVLSATLAACNADPVCAADVGGDAEALYADVLDELQAGPITVGFPLASGDTESRRLTATDFVYAAAYSMYETTDRMIFLRALASAADGDFVPLLRLVYYYDQLDPQTLEFIPDPTFSNGMYYGVECTDYRFFDGTPDERAAAFIEAGNPVDEANPRMSSLFYTDLPCVFWPTEGAAERPEPFTGAGIPTFVLNTTTDPATPVSNGYAVFSRLDDGYMVTLRGGPHVIFGRGNLCPDAAITAFLIDDVLPEERSYICDGDLMPEYVPVAGVDDFPDAATLFEAIDAAIWYLPEYYYWDLITPLDVGCPYGGTISIEPTDDGDAMTLDACEMIDGVALTGAGESVYGESFVLDVALSGAVEGDVRYTRDDLGEMFSVSGIYEGEDAARVPVT